MVTIIYKFAYLAYLDVFTKPKIPYYFTSDKNTPRTLMV